MGMAFPLSLPIPLHQNTALAKYKTSSIQGQQDKSVQGLQRLAEELQKVASGKFYKMFVQATT